MGHEEPRHFYGCGFVRARTGTSSCAGFHGAASVGAAVIPPRARSHFLLATIAAQFLWGHNARLASRLQAGGGEGVEGSLACRSKSLSEPVTVEVCRRVIPVGDFDCPEGRGIWCTQVWKLTDRSKGDLKGGVERVMRQSIVHLHVRRDVECDGEEIVTNIDLTALSARVRSEATTVVHASKGPVGLGGVDREDAREISVGTVAMEGSETEFHARDGPKDMSDSKDMNGSSQAGVHHEGRNIGSKAQASQGGEGRNRRRLSVSATSCPENSGDTASGSRGQANTLQEQEHCGPGGCLSQYPVPLSPLSGEAAQRIEYERALVAETAMKSVPAITKSAILFEDDWLLVIDKPCGIYSEHVLATVPSLLNAGDVQTSVSRLSLQQPSDSNGIPVHLHLANRLDRDTSGVMVITKRKEAAGKLCSIFTKRQVQKSYVALCRGRRPLWTRLAVDTGHGRSRFGAWRVYSKEDVGRGLPGGSVVREMTTNLLVVAVNKQTVLDDHFVGEASPCKGKTLEDDLNAGDGDRQMGVMHRIPEGILNTLSEDISSDPGTTDSFDDVVIRATPYTGRTHQIRLHCQFVGLPLRGDVKYGGPHILDGVKYEHHSLHAESLSFRHPFTSAEMRFVAPLPQWATEAGCTLRFPEV